GSAARPFKNIYVADSTIYFVKPPAPDSETIVPSISAVSVENGNIQVSTVDPITNTLSDTVKVGSNYVNKREDKSLFDCITQQPNIFTKNTSVYTDGVNTTAKDINLFWHYDDIIAYMTDSSFEIQATFNYDNTYTQIIPHINNLYVDISYSPLTDGWKNYITIPITSNYNVSQYKSIKITRKQNAPSGLTSLNSLLFQEDIVEFDVRVYGENYGNNYPTIEERSLVYRNITFLQPNPPGIFDYISTIINNYSQITLTYNFTIPEEGKPSSTAILEESQTKYVEKDTLSSSSYALNTTINTDIETDDRVSGGNIFTVILSGLRAGTKYDFITRIKNDLSTKFNINDTSWNLVGTDQTFDTINGPTTYTNLPSSNGYSSTYTPGLNYNTTTNVTTSALNNASIIYINTSDTQTITPSNTNTQSFEITDSSATTSSTKGFGKYVDNKSGLITIKTYVNDVAKQTITYSGFTPDVTNKSGNVTRSISDVNYFDVPSQNDIYANNNQQQGYRLYGEFKLLTISNNDVETAIGVPSNTPYSLKLEVIRDSVNVGGTPTVSNTSSIYIDELPNNPNISQKSDIAVVTSVVWTMGIPSVKKYKIESTRTYSNINSQYKFVRGDRKLASVNSVSNTSNSTSSTNFTSNNVLIDSQNISETGIYTYTVTEYNAATNNALTSLHYTTSRNSTNSNVTLNETIYSLKSNGISNDITVTTNHHFDKNSYNNLGNSLASKLMLTDIYELDSSTISKMNDDLGRITTVQYSTHTTVPQE
ncbi:MAG: hypothetical protein ACO3UU_06775, partial [Minisyncoccia bacterium]